MIFGVDSGFQLSGKNPGGVIPAAESSISPETEKKTVGSVKPGP